MADDFRVCVMRRNSLELEVEMAWLRDQGWHFHVLVIWSLVYGRTKRSTIDFNEVPLCGPDLWSVTSSLRWPVSPQHGHMLQLFWILHFGFCGVVDLSDCLNLAGVRPPVECVI